MRGTPCIDPAGLPSSGGELMDASSSGFGSGSGTVDLGNGGKSRCLDLEYCASLNKPRTQHLPSRR